MFNIEILHFKVFQMCLHQHLLEFLTCDISKCKSDQRPIIKVILISCFVSRKYALFPGNIND